MDCGEENPMTKRSKAPRGLGASPSYTVGGQLTVDADPTIRKPRHDLL